MPLDPAFVAKLNTALDEGFAASKMPGVTVGLWIPGYGEWVATRGVSDLATKTPMNRLNQAKIGSITKTLVGTIALQVIGEGDAGLTLDSTIDRWYPAFPDATKITIRMLLNMSSGIAESSDTQLKLICSGPDSQITPDEMIAIGAGLPRMPYAPGKGFTYTAFNYFLLGRILEKVTNTDLATLMDERLLKPLGMTRTRFAPDGQLTPPLTRGYSSFCSNLPKPTDATDWPLHEGWAAGATLSTIDDLHTWGLALGAAPGITPELRAARVDDIAPDSGPAGTGRGYGLGVNAQRDPATGCVLNLGHSGAEPGYGADVDYFTTTGSVLALMGNSDEGTGVAFTEVLQALAPVITPVVTRTPTAPCPTAGSTPSPSASIRG